MAWRRDTHNCSFQNSMYTTSRRDCTFEAQAICFFLRRQIGREQFDWSLGERDSARNRCRIERKNIIAKVEARELIIKELVGSTAPYACWESLRPVSI